MRPPWDPSAQNAAELEALQTDVMRFIAIIGLCLMAVFSLVNSAAQERREAPLPGVEVSRAETPPAPAAVEGSATEAAPHATSRPTGSAKTGERSLQTPKQPSTPEPAAPSPPSEAVPIAEGFTLEFASADALSALLASGSIELFASREQQHWRYQIGGGFIPAEPPASYYPMHPETVPANLRALASRTLELTPDAWGVTLPSSTARQVRALMTGRDGGALLIGADGNVRPED